jgi:hemerythrin-like domain-containing protein
MTNGNTKTAGLSPVSKMLMEDHEQIRVLLWRLKELIQNISRKQASASLQEAQALLQALVKIMNTHALCEERLVFPAMEKYHPVAAIEAEHEEILLMRAAIVSGVLNYSFPEDCTSKIYNQYLDFLDLLQEHLKKEENTIFPLIDRSLPPEENQQIASQMGAIRSNV